MAILAFIFIDFSELLAMFSRHATTLFPVQLRAILYRAASASSLRKDEASTHFFITLGRRNVSSWSSDLGMYVAMSFSSISAFFEREDLKLAIRDEISLMMFRKILKSFRTKLWCTTKRRKELIASNYRTHSHDLSDPIIFIKSYSGFSYGIICSKVR